MRLVERDSFSWFVVASKRQEYVIRNSNQSHRQISAKFLEVSPLCVKITCILNLDRTILLDKYKAQMRKCLNNTKNITQACDCVHTVN